MRALAKKACVWQLRDDSREGLVKSCFVRWLFTFIFLGEGNKKSFKLSLPSKENALYVTSECIWSAEIKVINFQISTEPIRLIIISTFPSIIKNELTVLQQRDTVQICAELRITYDTLLATGFLPFNNFVSIIYLYQKI